MFKKYNIGKLLNKKLLKDLWNNKWGKRSVIGFLVMALVTVAIAWPESGQKVVRKEWAVVNRGPFVVYLVESGEIVSMNEAVITAPMMFVSSLQIIDLVPEGAMVKKGDFLIQFDITDLQERLELEIDALISLKADMDKLKAQQGLTTESLDDQLILARYETEQANLRLQMRQFESDAKKEEARLKLKQAEIDLERVGKQIKSQKIIHTGQIMKSQLAIHHRQGHVKEYQAQIQWFTLTAPVDGMGVNA